MHARALAEGRGIDLNKKRACFLLFTGYRLCRRAPKLDESTIGRTLCSMLTGCLAAGRLAAVARRFSGQGPRGPGAQGPRGQGPGARGQGPWGQGPESRGQGPGARGRFPVAPRWPRGIRNLWHPVAAVWDALRNLSNWLAGWLAGQGVSQPVATCGNLWHPVTAVWDALRNLSSWLAGWLAGARKFSGLRRPEATVWDALRNLCKLAGWLARKFGALWQPVATVWDAPRNLCKLVG